MECWNNGFKGILSAFKVDIFIVLPIIPSFQHSAKASLRAHPSRCPVLRESL